MLYRNQTAFIYFNKKILWKLKFEANFELLSLYYLKIYIHFQQHNKTLYNFNSDVLINF
jgi:hypothetical protein